MTPGCPFGRPTRGSGRSVQSIAVVPGRRRRHPSYQPAPLPTGRAISGLAASRPMDAAAGATCPPPGSTAKLTRRVLFGNIDPRLVTLAGGLCKRQWGFVGANRRGVIRRAAQVLPPPPERPHPAGLPPATGRSATAEQSPCAGSICRRLAKTGACRARNCGTGRRANPKVGSFKRPGSVQEIVPMSSLKSVRGQSLRGFARMSTTAPRSRAGPRRGPGPDAIRPGVVSPARLRRRRRPRAPQT